MEGIEKIIEEIYDDDPKMHPLCADIGSRISKNELKLVEVVEALGSKLTNKDAMIRSKALSILAAVFANFQPDQLTEVELEFIVEFLHNRLQDQHLVIPKAIHCIKAIISCNNLPKGAAGKLLLQLFREANIQSHIHKDRHAFFLILSYILDEKVDEISDWSSDFVMYFIQSVDGEKDPRNLLLIFRCVPLVINNFPIANFVEDLFEVLSCYFPVDFNPTNLNSDAEVITRESIASALHLCLSHTNQFAPYLVPLIVEKLESTLMVSKLDSIKLLEMCCQRSYNPENLEPFLSSLWRVLSKEIFLGAHDTIHTEMLQLMTAVFEMLSKSPSTLTTSVNMVFAECKHHLMEPELRLMQPASSILLSVAKASESACTIIVSLVLPLLYEQFLVKSVTSERKAILDFFNRTVTVTLNYPNVKLPSFLPKWDEIMATFFNLLSHEDSEIVKISLDFFILTLRGLDSHSVDLLQIHLLNLLCGQVALAKNTRLCVMSCLDVLAFHYPSSLIVTTVTPLLKSSETAECKANARRHELVLAAIAECSYVTSVAEITLPVILKTIKEEIAKIGTQGNSMESSLSQLLAYCRCILSLVKKGILRKSPNFLDILCTKLDVVEILIELALRCRSTDDDDVAKDSRHNAFIVAVDIIRNVTRAANEEIQSRIVSSVEGIEVEAPGLLLESALGSVRRSVVINNKRDVMDGVLRAVCDGSGDNNPNFKPDSDSIALIRLFATMLNKMESDNDFSEYESRLEKISDSLIASTNLISSAAPGVNLGNGTLQNGSTGVTRYMIELLVWSVKGLAMRGAKSFEAWIERIITLLGVPAVGNLLADNFEILMEDSLFSLNSESHCNYRFLYKQRIFLSSVPKLVSAYKKATPEDQHKVNYIRALSCQLRYIPQDVLRMELENVLPLLVASLTCGESSIPIRKSCLDALYNLLTDAEKESPLTSYFHDVVPHLVTMATDSGSMDVRIVAVKCLQKFVKFPTHMVLLEKPKVVLGLKTTLDDPKRLVRKEAVIARNLWILTGAPGGI